MKTHVCRAGKGMFRRRIVDTRLSDLSRRHCRNSALTTALKKCNRIKGSSLPGTFMRPEQHKLLSEALFQTRRIIQ